MPALDRPARAHARARHVGALLHDALRLDLREGALELRRPARDQRHHDDPVPPRIPRERAGARGEVPAHERRRARLLRGVRARLSRRLLGRPDAAGPDAVLEGDDEVRHPLDVHGRGDRLSRAARRGVLLARDRVVHARLRRELRLRDPPARRGRRRRHQPRQPRPQPADGRREQHQHLREDLRLERLPRQRAHGRSEPPRRDARRAAARAHARLPADAAHAPPQVVARRDARLPAARGDRHALAQRLARARRRRARSS